MHHTIWFFSLSSLHKLTKPQKMITASRNQHTTFDLSRCLPPELTICNSKTLDIRGIHSKNRYSRNQIILTIKPTLKVLHSRKFKAFPDYRATACGFCNRTGVRVPSEDSVTTSRETTTNLIQCTGCRVVRYCNEECYMADQPYHQFECPFLRNHGLTVPSEDARMMIRVIAWCGQNKNNYYKFISFSNHLNDIKLSLDPQITLRYTDVTRYFPEIEWLKSNYIRNATNGYLNELTLESVMAVVMVNCATMTNCFCEPIGLAFDPLYALMNHSCDPNVTFAYNDDKLIMVATKDIEAGSELFMSYCFQDQPTMLRKNQLSSLYFFNCTCWKCQYGERIWTTTKFDINSECRELEIMENEQEEICGCLLHNQGLGVAPGLSKAQLAYYNIFLKFWHLSKPSRSQFVSSYTLCTDRRYFPDLASLEIPQNANVDELASMIRDARAQNYFSMKTWPVPQAIYEIGRSYLAVQDFEHYFEFAFITVFDDDIRTDIVTFTESLRELSFNIMKWAKETNGRNTVDKNCALYFGLRARHQLFSVYGLSAAGRDLTMQISDLTGGKGTCPVLGSQLSSYIRAAVFFGERILGDHTGWFRNFMADTPSAEELSLASLSSNIGD